MLELGVDVVGYVAGGRVQVKVGYQDEGNVGG